MRLIGASDIAPRAVRTAGAGLSDKVALPTQSRALRSEDGIGVATVFARSDSKPVFDADRVAEIRKAIAEDRYPLVPAKIADAMIAAKLYGIVGA